eukprot:CAMPEP_0198289778 /NCGR_PEP_ID=MMETSP1449-20131203/7855_1 /TAXON_ID=420275 /ORGANISM="Attheya septentrionalis, Strain CCMP2084" /LENGTH=440 /DNA_ID=CAMNT_0043988165 /DNA_START=110 /DNA_END=1432 /DNA_ORIENTATION=-
MERNRALSSAARFRVRPEASEWGYNWEYAECGTPKPTPREGYGTMWMVANNSDSALEDVKLFFTSCSKQLRVKLYSIASSDDDDDDDEEERFKVVRLGCGRDAPPLLTGRINGSADNMDPNVGKYAEFVSTSVEGLALMKQIQAVSSPNRTTVIEHSIGILPVSLGYKLIVITGTGPDKKEGESVTDNMALSTRFQLFDGSEEIARCHLSYTDGSFDPSMGPTIEQMVVKQSKRGFGILKLLWHWVRCFVEENFRIECLNNDAPLGHIMVKATQLTGAEVEIRTRKNCDNISVSDKDFFFKYLGFSVKEQKGIMAAMMAGGSGRPQDEEAVIYIPLLSPAEHVIRARGGRGDEPTRMDGKMKKQHGNKVCERCRKAGSRDELSACAQCKSVWYCGRECQKSDWKIHKVWCGKDAHELHDTMIAKGRRHQNSDGTWVDIVG